MRQQVESASAFAVVVAAELRGDGRAVVPEFNYKRALLLLHLTDSHPVVPESSWKSNT